MPKDGSKMFAGRLVGQINSTVPVELALELADLAMRSLLRAGSAKRSQKLKKAAARGLVRGETFGFRIPFLSSGWWLPGRPAFPFLPRLEDFLFVG